MQRELYTIGDLGSVSIARPLGRSNARRRAFSMGATIANWSPPSAVNMNAVGTPLQNAAVALQNYLDTNGVPALTSTNGGQVSAFQSAWNADSVAGVAPIDVDDAYGPNTYAALNAITGEARPPQGGAVTPATPGTVVPSSSSASFPWGTVLLVGGGLAAVYFLFLRKRRKKSGGTVVEVKSNPRRRAAARRGKKKARGKGKRR